MDAHFPNMETVAGLNLHFDGTRVYMIVARSFSGSHALVLAKQIVVQSKNRHGYTRIYVVSINGMYA